MFNVINNHTSCVYYGALVGQHYYVYFHDLETFGYLEGSYLYGRLRGAEVINTD